EEETNQRSRAEALQQGAEAARDEAEQQRGRAEFALYVNRVMRAHVEWKDHAVGRADQLLDQCPRDLRNWEWRYVKRLCHADLLSPNGYANLLTLRGHSGPVNGVCFSPNGKRLASASSDGTLKVWDAATGQEGFTLKGGPLRIGSACFSP